jgi:hypothetical protein
MSEPINDPVSRVRMSFEPEGENLIVSLWLEPGGGLPAHFPQGRRSAGRWWRGPFAFDWATTSE